MTTRSRRAAARTQLGVAVAAAGLAMGLAGAASAQTLTLTNGDATFTVAGDFDSNLPNCNWATDTAAADQMATLSWYYRTPNNNQNTPFGSAFSAVITQVAPNVVRLNWTNAGPGPLGQERFDAQVTLTLVDGATPNAGLVQQEMIFTSASTNTGSRVFEVFNQVDADLGGSGQSNAATLVPASGTGQYTRPSPSTDVANLTFDPPTRVQVSTGSAIRTLLGSGSGNLNNVATLSGTDVATAMQWTLTLNPGESRTIRSAFAINQPTQIGCAADCDASGSLSPADFTCFLGKYRAGDSSADCDGSGGLSPADFTCFLAKYRAGCP
jgi:hypothetical protein